MHDFMAEAKARETGETERRAESHMLLQRVAEACTEVTTEGETPVTSRESNVTETSSKAALLLNSRGTAVNDIFVEHVNRIFDHGQERIRAVRHACDTAEAALENKRNKVLESVASLVYCMQEVDIKSEEMQKSLGDMLVATDQI